MALDSFFHNKIEGLKLEIIQGQAVLRRLEAQRNDYNSRVRLLREELGLLQQPGSYVGEVVKVMGTKKVLVKVHPEGKYGIGCILPIKSARLLTESYYSRRHRRQCRYLQTHSRQTRLSPFRFLQARKDTSFLRRPVGFAHDGRKGA
jgi:ATP-dependent 26S proteasome regulatory subunit